MYKEIVTKAVIGKGKKHFTNNYVITTEVEPTTVLGCWIINHTFKGTKQGDKILVDGSFDINVWYSHDKDSKTSVSSKSIAYSELVGIKVKENSDLSDEAEIIVRGLKQPVVSNVNLKDGNIDVTVDKELGIELVGDTKVKISVEEDEEPWDEIGEEYSDEVEKEIDEKVDENFI